jgi:hypothetical protein
MGITGDKQMTIKGINFKLLKPEDRNQPCNICKSRLSVKYLLTLDNGKQIHVCNKCVFVADENEK